MSEQIKASPFQLKHTPERNRVAAHIMYSRFLERERSGEYTTNRDATRYINSLLGLRHFLNYIRSLPPGNIVLDIGVGQSIGINQLAIQEMGEGLTFVATGLTRDPKVQEHIGNANDHITCSETLKGIADESIGGVIALHSITYSEAPSQTIDRINEVLVPGGSLKATFRNDGFQDRDNFVFRSKYKKHDEFSQRLFELGYDVAFIERLVIY